MGEIEELNDVSCENWTSVAPELNLPQLNNLDCDGVNIQCVNSSEFVVGKQTNFNGPVTIINCPNQKVLDDVEESKEEKIIIRDKVLSRSAATTIDEMAKGSNPAGPQVKKRKYSVRTWMVVSFAVIVFLVAAAVSLAVVLDRQEGTDPENGLPRCERVSKNVCLYSGFPFTRKHHVSRPLTGPVPYVIISQTYDYFCYDLEECLTALKFWFEKDTPCNFLLGGDGNVYEDLGWEPSTNSTYRFYSKSDWGGQPEKSFVIMKIPIPYVVVSHSASSQCSSLANCSPLIQGIQNYHQSISFADIAYNFLVDSSGNIYEGRGWVRRNVKGGFTNGRNIDVCLIGDFSESTHPSEDQMNGLSFLLEFGVSMGYVSPDYSLIAANATYATLSPGIHAYDIIKDWPHFDPDPISHVKDFEK